MIAAAVIAIAAVAQGPVLPVKTAKARATSAARVIARQQSPPARYAVDGCERRSRRTVDCVALYRLADTNSVCAQTIRVRYEGRTGRRIDVSYPSAFRCRSGPSEQQIPSVSATR